MLNLLNLKMGVSSSSSIPILLPLRIPMGDLIIFDFFVYLHIFISEAPTLFSPRGDADSRTALTLLISNCLSD